MELSDSFHVTLSKTLYLKHYQLLGFEQSLNKNLKYSKNKVTLELNLSQIEILPNEENTRLFIGVKVKSVGSDKLL